MQQEGKRTLWAEKVMCKDRAGRPGRPVAATPRLREDARHSRAQPFLTRARVWVDTGTKRCWGPGSPGWGWGSQGDDSSSQGPAHVPLDERG